MTAKSRGRKHSQTKKTKSRPHTVAAPSKVTGKKAKEAAPVAGVLPVKVTDEEIMEKTADYGNVPRELRKVALVGSVVIALLIALAVVLS